MSKEQAYKFSSSDSDSESYDLSSAHGKELAGGRPYRRKGILDKTSIPLPKRGHQKYKGKFTTYNTFWCCVNLSGDKRQRLEASGSDDHLSKQQTYYKHILPESDSESYDLSSAYGKEPAGGRPYKRKGILDKTSTSLPKRGHQKHKGKFNTVYNSFYVMLNCHRR